MATPSPNEIFPLVPGDQEKYGVYADGYSPVDDESRMILRKRRYMKLGAVTVVLAVVAFLGVRFMATQQQYDNGFYRFPSSAVEADHLFAGLLADDKAFYFPLAARPEDTQDVGHRSLLRRVLKKSSKPKKEDSVPPAGVDWTYDWTANAKNGAAIGEYYMGKGLAMQDYYRSKFDPTYKITEKEDADAGGSDKAKEGVAPWTYDWSADAERGIAIGKKYSDIGQAIGEHYREAFDPTYPGPGHRMLKSKDKKKKDKKKKELAYDAATGWNDWTLDKDRGMAIGLHFKELGEKIADHYNTVYNPMYDVNQETYTKQNWPEVWKAYKKRGDEIGAYYKNKGAAIKSFYDGPYTPSTAQALQDQASASAAKQVAKASKKATVSVTPDFAQLFGGPKNSEEATAVHNDMMQKGLAIGEYYRAKYDPTYGSSDMLADTEANLGSTREDADAEDTAGDEEEDADDAANDNDLAHHPDLDYPPWGQDPASDSEHGKAMGQYWKIHGKAKGAKYKMRGKELGKHYKEYYRSQFDPTYKKGTEGN